MDEWPRIITSGLKVPIFLTSAAVDLVRRRAIDNLVIHPLEPLAALMKDFLARGGKLWACTPCANRMTSITSIRDDRWRHAWAMTTASMASLTRRRLAVC